MKAGIYCRISRDPSGDALGVARQERDCREYCERRGWTVTDLFVDNDRSAYSAKRRPAYEAMLAAIGDGLVNVVVVWHPDRLHRSPVELERFISILERTDVEVATVTAGDLDLATPEGRLVARIVGSVARKESEDKSRRNRRKHVELAELGRPGGGGLRPFGYEDDRVTIRESEAAEIRRAVLALLAGDSIRSIAADWRDRIPSVTGVPWSPTTVKRLVTSARIAGHREHHGRRYPAIWPAIIEIDEVLKLRALFGAKGGSHRAVRSYVLSGLVRCGRCDALMTARPVVRKGNRYRRYACVADRGGCDRCGIGAEPLEDLVAAAVAARVDGSELAEHMPDDVEVTVDDSPRRVADLEDRLRDLAEMFADGQVSRPEFQAARARIDERLDEARAAATARLRQGSVVPYVGRSADLATAWPSLNIDRRRAILAALVDVVVIAPTTRANNRFDPGRVTIDWRV